MVAKYVLDKTSFKKLCHFVGIIVKYSTTYFDFKSPPPNYTAEEMLNSEFKIQIIHNLFLN